MSSSIQCVLQCHPSTPCHLVQTVEVTVVTGAGANLQLEYRIAGDIAQLAVPVPDAPLPADRLWEHTCCEIFAARVDESAYHEWNFSPTGQHAHFCFDGYRERAASGPTCPATVSAVHDAKALALTAALELPASLNRTFALALTTVIRDARGNRSYWALHHPGERPDFHARAGFTVAVSGGSFGAG